MVALTDTERVRLEGLALRYTETQTGGELFGTWDGRTARVTCVIGPGRLARRSEAAFMQDELYSNKCRALLAGQGLRQVGYWRSYHQSSPAPTQLDVRTMHAFAQVHGPCVMVVAAFVWDASACRHAVNMAAYVYSAQSLLPVSIEQTADATFGQPPAWLATVFEGSEDDRGGRLTRRSSWAGEYTPQHQPGQQHGLHAGPRNSPAARSLTQNDQAAYPAQHWESQPGPASPWQHPPPQQWHQQPAGRSFITSLATQIQEHFRLPFAPEPFPQSDGSIALDLSLATGVVRVTLPADYLTKRTVTLLALQSGRQAVITAAGSVYDLAAVIASNSLAIIAS